jgi:alpha-1,2-mannosyltransferase
MPPSLEIDGSQRSPQAHTSRWLWLVLGLYFFSMALNPAFITKPAIDFKCYFVASRCRLAGENMYDFQQMTHEGDSRPDTVGTLYPYLYPPTLAMLLTPLAKLHLWWASFLWHLFSVGLTILAALLGIKLCRAAVPLNPTGASAEFFLPAVAVGLLFLLPFPMQFEWGQVNVLVAVLILLALLQSYAHRRDHAAGALLACAAFIKFTPAYLLLYFLCQRRWKVATGFVIASVVLMSSMLALPGGYRAWLQFFEFLPSTGYGKTIAGLYPPLGPASFSVAGFWARLTANESLVATLTYASLIALVAGVLAMHFRLRDQKSARLLLLSHLIVMVVAAPYAYLHHVTFIYPGVLLTAYALWQLPQRRGTTALVLLSLCTLIASIYFPRLYSLASLHYAFRSINLVGLLGLYCMGLWAAELSSRLERTPSKG